MTAGPYALEALLPLFRTAGEEMRGAGLVASHGGNLSVWTPDGVLITREGAMLGRLTAADLCLVSRTTRPPDADPSLDTPIHRALYAMSPGRAVVHAHPAYAVALSLLYDELTPLDPEGAHALGSVPVLANARDIVRQVGEALADGPVVLVRGHGSYARGADLSDALRTTTQLEESARLLYLSRLIAQPEPAAPAADGTI